MIPFVDLKAQYAGIKTEVNAAIQGVLDSCQFTLGSEVAKFEDFETRRRMEDDYVGFWVQYKYDEGYGGQLRYRGVIS